jgi:hypothetical protein
MSGNEAPSLLEQQSELRSQNGDRSAQALPSGIGKKALAASMPAKIDARRMTTDRMGIENG